MTELEVSRSGFVHLEESWLCPDFQEAEFLGEAKGKKGKSYRSRSAQWVHKYRDVALHHHTSFSFPHLHCG